MSGVFRGFKHKSKDVEYVVSAFYEHSGRALAVDAKERLQYTNHKGNSQNYLEAHLWNEKIRLDGLVAPKHAKGTLFEVALACGNLR